MPLTGGVLLAALAVGLLYMGGVQVHKGAVKVEKKIVHVFHHKKAEKKNVVGN